MQDFSGDSTPKASSPMPTPSDNRPQTTRGRGRPAGDNIRIPWQVLELTADATAAGGRGNIGGSVVGEVNKPEDPNRSKESSRVASHKRKHSDIITAHSSDQHPRSPTKSPVQQEAPDNETPASGDDNDAVKYSSDGVASQENANMKPSAAAAVSEKEEIGAKPFEAAKEKNEEDPSADADDGADEDNKEIEFSEAVGEKNEEDPSVDDAVINDEENKEMESLEAAEEKNEKDPSDSDAVTDGENKEKESFEEIAEEKNGDEPSADKEGKDKEAFETAEKKINEQEQDSSADDKESVETAEGEHKEQPSGAAGEKPVTDSSDAAEKRMKFSFDLNELPGDEDDEDMP